MAVPRLKVANSAATQTHELNLTPYVSFLHTLIRQEENTNAVKAESWTSRWKEGCDKVDCHKPAVNTNVCFEKEDNSEKSTGLLQRLRWP
ncbi:hypothetical protein MHYP_G00271770 [Metynnis hypsauchen]